MFQLEGIRCISRERSSGVFRRAAQYTSPIGKDENPSTLFGLVWCYWPLGIVAFVTDQQISRKWTIAQDFSRVWQGFNLGSSSSLDSSEKLQLTDTVWFGVTDAMRFSESLLFSKPCNFLITAGQTSTCDWWERPAAINTLNHHRFLYSNIDHSLFPLLLLHISHNIVLVIISKHFSRLKRYESTALSSQPITLNTTNFAHVGCRAQLWKWDWEHWKRNMKYENWEIQ